ncbi:MAG: DNA polymerase [Desulfuromonadaceae bacterium]|nr:DNA polymerase [Desulfuromonadaceae bacterium]
MKTIIYDIESDNLLLDTTTIHCVGVKVNDEETKIYTSRPISGSNGSIDDAINIIRSGDIIVGHNVVKFDNAVIRKLFGTDFFGSGIKHFDTLIASQLRYPNMVLIDSNNKTIDPKLKGKHSLASWGQRLGYAKGDHDDWSCLSHEMMEYCKRDVDVTYKLYNKLKDEVPEEAMRLEQKFAYIIGRQEEYGVLFDVEAARKLHVELLKEQEEAIDHLYKTFKPLLLPNGTLKVPSKSFTRLGVTTVGEHQPIALTTFNPKSGHHIVWWIEKLYGKQKWLLTDKGSPKTGEDDLLRMFEAKPWAKPLVHYLQVKKLLGQLAEGSNAWLVKVRDDNRIHGEVNTLGAVSRRCTHNNPNLAQVPSTRAYKGQECRALFTVPKGYKMVGCDADALELRTLSHYMARYDGGKYGEAVDSGDKSKGTDIHTLNQKAAGLPTRDDAKTFIYAFLYGAGAEKLGTIINGTAKEGNKLKQKFFKKIPAIKALVDGVGEAVKSKGFLKALDDNRYFIRSEHSALNTLLQGAGALVMKYYTTMLYDNVQKYGDKVHFILNIHDECQLEVSEEIADEVAKVCEDTFLQVTEVLNFRVPLKGSAAIGCNWADTH